MSVSALREYQILSWSGHKVGKALISRRDLGYIKLWNGLDISVCRCLDENNDDDILIKRRTSR
jgi:hypothetical protein